MQTDEKIEYLEEHVEYERCMLRYSYRALHNTEPGAGWNAMYECFGVHARNLYDFLRHEGKKTNTFRADSYASGRSKPEYLAKFNELDSFLFHMAENRLSREKLNLSTIRCLVKWIDREWDIWCAQLPETYKKLIDRFPIEENLTLTVGVTENTACTAISISSIEPTGDSSIPDFTYVTRKD